MSEPDGHATTIDRMMRDCTVALRPDEAAAVVAGAAALRALEAAEKERENVATMPYDHEERWHRDWIALKDRLAAAEKVLYALRRVAINADFPVSLHMIEEYFAGAATEGGSEDE